MALHITDHRGGFGPGLTAIARIEDRDPAMGLGLEVLVLRAGERHAETTPGEMAALLMAGRARVMLGDVVETFARGSLFDDGPSAVHVAADTALTIEAESDCEFTLFRCANRKAFAARVYRPADVPDEHRGAGQVGGACLRLVRTIFDNARSDANAELVLGEVVTLPGRWSSYPPHHHNQPEIYHYRFDKKQGFGHAEHGESVVKIRHGDSFKITAGNDHVQCAAPGYAMYYAWVIRHLPGDRYTVPEFTAEHRWTMQPGAEIWMPKAPRDG